MVQDGPGDPRVGVTGGSYGGALALLLAGYDRRDRRRGAGDHVERPGAGAVPERRRGARVAAGGHPGPRRLRPGRGVQARMGRGVLLRRPGSRGGRRGGRARRSRSTAAASGAGRPTRAPRERRGEHRDGRERPRSAAPAPRRRRLRAAPTGRSATCGRFTPAVCAAYTEAATTGRLSPATAELLRRSSPASVTDRITAPTLVVQGEADTLFGLDQADATARQIAAAGGTVRVLWYGGGHDGGGVDQRVRDAIGDWFDHWLAGKGGDPGASFGYTVASGVRTGGDTPTSRTVEAPAYPGLAGAPAVSTQPLPLEGEPQVALVPAGGNPAAITALPGLGGALGTVGSRIAAFTAELPGQSATFRTAPVAAPLLVAGTPRVDLTVARVPGQPAPDAAVLFGKVYEVTSDGTRTLLGGAVAPVRVAGPGRRVARAGHGHAARRRRADRGGQPAAGVVRHHGPGLRRRHDPGGVADRARRRRGRGARRPGRARRGRHREHRAARAAARHRRACSAAALLARWRPGCVGARRRGHRRAGAAADARHRRPAADVRRLGRWRSATSPRPTAAGSARCAGCPSASSAGRCSACSARTAPARPPRCGC